jgi:tRNA-2-methylthio-N6-dimethylallyladenosine synthase
VWYRSLPQHRIGLYILLIRLTEPPLFNIMEQHSLLSRAWKLVRVAIVGVVLVLQPQAVQGFQPAISRSQHVNHRHATSRLDTKTASAVTDTDAGTTPITPTTTTSAPASPWFPRRIQETVDYGAVVRGLYLRHIVTERADMAQAALHAYIESMSSPPVESNSQEGEQQQHKDPFGYVASLLSACTYTREEGGTIGWVEPPDKDILHKNNNVDTVNKRPPPLTTASVVLPESVIQQVYEQTPKAGDILIVQSTETEQWHIVYVSELWMDMPLSPTARQWGDTTSTTTGKTKTKTTTSTSTSSTATTNEDVDENAVRTGSHGGSNTVFARKKLKGQGVLPVLPANTMKTYHIQTAGCQMNLADSERMAGILEHQLHLTVTDKPEQADLVVFNTCSIRDHAEQKLYDALGPYCAKKRQGKQIALIVTGCVAQQEGEALLRRVPEIDVVLGPQYVPFLPHVLDQVMRGQAHQVVVTEPMLLQEDIGWNQPVRGHTVRAWVNIIHGCNEHCTYCVVPGTRGMEQSRTMEHILQECLNLSQAGFKEVTLLGQNIDAYGRDMTPKRTFADLLEFLNANLPDPEMRIRYVTSHPRYFSDRVIDAVANLDKVCECFHMPFQAGDDQVLQKMRRGYTYASYMKIIDKIRAKAPDASICGDVIVGFPGETEEAFLKTLELMEEVKFDNLNTFAYSPRPNTEAALWDNQIPEDVKSDRLQRVQVLAAKHGLERSERYVGRTVPVLVEDRNPKNPNQVMGRTRQGRQAYFDGDLEQLKGKLVNVRITEARTWSLMGEPAA